MSFKNLKAGTSLPLLTFLASLSICILCLPTIQGAQSCDSNGAFKDGAEQFVEIRRSQRRGAKNKAEILWDPTEMLTDPTRYKVAAAELEMMQDDDQEWSIADVTIKNHGKSIKWTVKVKPCKKYNFRIRVTENELNGGEACLPINQALDPLSPEEIQQSGYTPLAPTDFKANVYSGHAELSWKPSDCAESYEVGYDEAGEGEGLQTLNPNPDTPTQITVTDLKPCTRYETFIYANLNTKYSELATEFATEPRLDAASTLAVDTNAGLDSVQVSWPSWDSVSCIDKYMVKACKSDSDECTDEKEVDKSVGSPFVSTAVSGLEACTDYILHIRPLFKDLDIEAKQISFRTNSKDASEVNVGRVGSTFSSGEIMINWDPVQCASKYKIYQKEVGADDWIGVDEIPATEATQTTVSSVTPCTTYQFAITGVLVAPDGTETETAKELGPEVITALDETVPFKAPRFTPTAGDDKLDITWGHADCIDSYIVKACPTDVYTDCPEEAVAPENNGNKMISHTITGLQSCTEYDVHIIPVRESSQFTAHPERVTTSNGVPEAPAFDVGVSDSTGASVTWTPVNCASAYKIYYKAGDDAQPEVLSVSKDEVEKVISENRPCQQYSYTVTTMVNEDESETSEGNWKNVVIPPKKDLVPTIKIVDDDQGKVTLKIDLAEENNQCGIDQYEVQYSSGKSCCDGNECEMTTITATPSELNNGDIVLNVTGGADSTLFKARVKYTIENEWSAHAEHGALSSRLSNCTEPGLPLIPIIVGVAVLALVVIIVTVLLVKRSRNRNFDPEKAENGSSKHHQNLVNSSEEETEKLNTAHA